MKFRKLDKKLACARPSGQDDRDPLIAEALQQLNGSEEQQRLFKEQRQRDAAISAELQATPVPAALREQILSRMQQAANEPKARQPAPWLRRAVRLGGIAAVLALGSGIGLVGWSKYEHHQFQNEDRFRDAMAFYISDIWFSLDYLSDDLRGIERWLDLAGATSMPQLTDSLTSRIPLGCKQVEWNGVQVSLICFFQDLPGDRIIHLFIAPRDQLSEATFAGIEQVMESYGLETKGWVTSEHVCVLVPSKPNMPVRSLVPRAVS